MTTQPLVEVEELRIDFPSPSGWLPGVRGVSLAMGREKLGIVGESGSGKSITGRALLRLLPASARITATKLRFDGIDIATASVRTLRQLRGARIGLVMQDPKFSLNPVMTIGAQISEALRAHRKLGRREAQEKAENLLEQVRIRDVARVANAYPHELSGGMGQRAMIAMMVAPDPDLLIADEPTSALDASVQETILELIDEMVARRGMGLILISHDLPLVAKFCDRVAVMYAGRVVETLEARDLAQARHPYTQGLLACLPRIDRAAARLPVLARDPAWLDP
jgi:peptide/nickel transport system ATP-binding protein